MEENANKHGCILHLANYKDMMLPPKTRSGPGSAINV